jgi:hypothetical protein
VALKEVEMLMIYLWTLAVQALGANIKMSCLIFLLKQIWLGRAELLQSLLGSGIIASLDDIADKESSTSLRDRLVSDERYSMAVYTSKKCKVLLVSVL